MKLFGKKYVLDGHKPVLCDDEKVWGDFVENGDRRVAADDVGDIWISTIFLGLDHQFDEGPPELFETLIFRRGEDGDRHGAEQWRCSTWDEAERQHAEAVALVRQEIQ